MTEAYPKLRIICGWIDQGLDENKFIVPGKSTSFNLCRGDLIVSKVLGILEIAISTAEFWQYGGPRAMSAIVYGSELIVEDKHECPAQQSMAVWVPLSQNGLSLFRKGESCDEHPYARASN